MARRETDFTGVFEAGWFQRHLTALLTYEDAICVALMAIECNLESLHHVLLYNALPIPPIPILKLANYVAERGWWHLLVQLPREARRPLRDSLSTTCFLDETPLVQCQWIMCYHPYELRDSVFYAAVRRGNLEEIGWLHEYIRYSPSRAIDEAAEAHHLTAVQWLLDRWGGERGYFKTFLRLEDSSLNVICWKSGDFVYCASSDQELLTCRANVSNLAYYPLMNEAAKRGDLEKLRKLHGGPIGTAMCTYGAMAKAAKQGHLEIMRWLHEHRSEHLGNLTEVLIAAAEGDQVEVLEWLHQHFDLVKSAKAAYKTAVRGNLPMAKYFFENDPEQFTFHSECWSLCTL